MQWDDYNALARQGFDKIAQNPYLACFKGTIALAIEEMKALGNQHPSEETTIDFFFDDSEAMKPIADRTYDQVYEQFPELRKFLAKKCRFDDDKEIPGLQAADLIAWHVRKSVCVRGTPLEAKGNRC